MFLMLVGSMCYIVTMFCLFDIIGGTLFGAKVCILIIPIGICTLLHTIKKTKEKKEFEDNLHMSVFLRKYEDGIF